MCSSDLLGRRTTYGYDDADRRIRETRPEGGVHETGYDARDNRTFERDPEGRTRRMIWDARSRLVAAIDG